MAMQLMKGAILIDVAFQTEAGIQTAPMVLDTGAEGFGVIDTDFAKKLGVPLTGGMPVSGVAGTATAYDVYLKQISLKGVPDCVIDDKSGTLRMLALPLGPLFRKNAAGLLGLDFMRKAQMTIEFPPAGPYGSLPENVLIRCKTGKAVEMPIKQYTPPSLGELLSPWLPWAILGGLLAIGTGTYFAVSD